MLKHVAIILLGCCFWLGFGASAWATGDNSISKSWLDESRKFQTRVQDASTALKAQESLGQAEVCSYLRDTAWMVYKALDAYSCDNHNVPDDLQQLVTDGYMSFWPENPLNDWQPMQVLKVEDGFMPGELVVQWAPISHQSIVGKIEDYQLRPLSYEIAVYGWTEDSKAYGPATPLKENTWAVTPKGIIIMLGTATETAAQTLEKIRKRVLKQQQESQR